MIYQKRYQYYSNNGIVWTEWFNCTKSVFDAKERWQMKGRLLNEYRIIRK